MMLRRVANTIIPVVVIWIALIVFGLLADAEWPDAGTTLISFAALCIVATFLLLVSTMMVRRMHGKDGLTLALAFAFATDSLMPFYLMGSILWRAFFQEHRLPLLIATATTLIVGSMVAIIALILTPDNGNQRAEDYAAGVAQEQRDQMRREEAV